MTINFKEEEITVDLSKRFWFISYDIYYPSRFDSDIVKTFDTLEQLKDYVYKQDYWFDYNYYFDRKTNKYYEVSKKMNKKKLKKEINKLKRIRTLVLVLLVPLWIILTILTANYSISYDKHYTSTVNIRAFDNNDNSITDFKEGVVAMQDARGSYENKNWKLKYKELYYLQSGFIIGLLIGAIYYLIWIVIDFRITNLKINNMDYDDDFYYRGMY